MHTLRSERSTLRGPKALWFGVLATWLAACASDPPPVLVVPVPVELGSLHFAGTMLAGVVANPALADAVAAEDCLEVRLRVDFVDGLEVGGSSPVGSRTRLVVGSRGGDPLRPIAELAIGARVATGEAARAVVGAADSLRGRPDRFVELGERQGALPSGVTFSAYLESNDPIVAEDGRTVRRRIGVALSREDDGDLSAVLFVEDVAPMVPLGEDTPQDLVRRQIVLLEDVPSVDGDPLVLLFPPRLGRRPGRAFLFDLRVATPDSDDSDHLESVEQCAAHLKQQAETMDAWAEFTDPATARRRALGAGLRALEIARDQRAALVFLAGQGDSALALDLSLCADDATLAAWVQLLGIEAGSSADVLAPVSISGASWQLERAAFQVLAERLDAGDIGSDLLSLLAQHAGEAGCFPGSVSSALARSPERSAFEAAIVRENLDFLESSDPTARVRAFDWLMVRDLAPADYDPLASRTVRREALAKTYLETEAEVAR